jgi:uncharacterized protein (DUF305 family)
MKNQVALYGIIGLLVGVVLTGTAMSLSGNKMDDMGGGHTAMSMDDMAKELQGKTGDDFDKAFIEMMIDHHQGAIDMAEEAKKNAKHDEIKRMADDIVSAQSSEISQMRDWQKQWGY